MKKKPTDLGKNQTGVDTAPIQSNKTIKGAIEGGASPKGDFPTAHAQILRQYQENLEPVGTMPPPAKLKGMAKSAVDMVKGQKTTVLLDKLGERLAFERTGTRLYELLLLKFDTHGTWMGGPTRNDLLEIRNDEHQHFQLLVDTMRGMGADPTALTPCADVTMVESLGLHNTIADVRTTLAQSLHAILIAELADNAGWELLIELAEGLGEADAAAKFRMAYASENEHLVRVKRWIRADVRSEAGMAPTAGPAVSAK